MTIKNQTTKERPQRKFLRRMLEVVAITCGASLFLAYGIIAILNNFLIGFLFVIVGIVGGVGAATYAFFGARLGVEIFGDTLVEHHYFNQRTVPLMKIRRFYRSVDATVIETIDSEFVIDDCMFADSKDRVALFDLLQSRLNSFAQGPTDGAISET